MASSKANCLAAAGTLLVLALTVQVALGQEENDLYYKNPVRNSSEDEIKNLPGLNDAINFKHYSGYLNADEKGKKFFHYWFVESQNDPAKDPVLLWLNGGPGCSSLGGLFTELGPFQVNDDGKTLKLNKFSWNKMANVLFLESPAGVGFSYSTSIIDVNTDDTTARSNHLALKSFFKKFPQFKNNKLYLAGESYAGVYLPTLGVLVDADPELNLHGIAIGNGYLDVAKLSESVIFFAYYHGLIGKTSWERISKDCCNGQAPARENCQMSGSNATYACLYLIYELNEQVMAYGINPYNLYSDCTSQSKQVSGQYYAELHEGRMSRDQVDKRLLRFAADPHTQLSKRPYKAFKTRDNLDTAYGVEPPCVDEHLLVSYLNQHNVRDAIHVPKRVSRWDTCSSIVYLVKYPKLEGGLSPQMKSLIRSKRKLALLVYNGDVDMVCNFLGDEWFVDDLGQKLIADYHTWKVGKQVGGYVKHYEGITFATVRGSGHMVPGDRPREAFEMIKVFLNSKNHNVLL
jgi:cathepsin A (carboxypeptidase C)